MSPNKWMWLVAGAALAACGAEKGNMSVSVKSAAVAPASATAGADLGNGITLTEVRMVVRRIDLATAMPPPATAPSPANMEHQGEDPDDFDVSFGPFPVDVKGSDLTGGIHPVFDAQVPKGKYLGARVVVNTLPHEPPAADLVLKAMQGLHASIAIDGTIDSAGFEFVTPMRVAQFKAGPINVDPSATPATRNLTLDVDPRGWFKGEKGTRLDPRLDRDRGEILENIRCSIRLFEDDDLDGEPDDGDRGEAPGCPPSTPPTPPPVTPPAAPPMTPAAPTAR